MKDEKEKLKAELERLRKQPQTPLRDELMEEVFQKIQDMEEKEMEGDGDDEEILDDEWMFPNGKDDGSDDLDDRDY